MYVLVDAMIEITPDLARAAATDAANRAMRKAGRTAWSEDDYDLAQQTFLRPITLPAPATRS
ncbi:MAG: hypothetical protein ABL951_05575 [Alphaproteobacteria bacterium]